MSDGCIGLLHDCTARVAQTLNECLMDVLHIAGLYGKTGTDGLRVDEVVGLTRDFSEAIYKIKFEKDETKKVGLTWKQ